MYILATWVLHIQIFTDVMKTSAHHSIITPVCVSAVLNFSTAIHISVTFTEESKVHQHEQHFPLIVNTYVCYIES